MILDLELKAPTLALIEEPEVHLHPGMESALEGYLRDKGKSIQLFITTHSTNFVDAAALQNVYVVAGMPEAIPYAPEYLPRMPRFESLLS